MDEAGDRHAHGPNMAGPHGPVVSLGGWKAFAIVATAAAVTTLDGFDAMSLSLMAPQIIRDLGIPTASLGPIFGSVFIGLLVGALVGGATADRLGHVRTLVGSLVLFGCAALAMPLMHTANAILVNRVIAGIGLGAAAPIAVALMASFPFLRISTFAIASVWAGIALGGVLAAAFNYLVVPTLGWQSLFIAGGLLPIPVAVAIIGVFRGHGIKKSLERRPGIAALFQRGLAARSAVTAAMFFFGYVVTSMLVSWLPTVLNHRGASALLVSSAFISINIGSTLGAVGLGFLAQRFAARSMLSIAWALAGLCLLGMAMSAFGVGALALLAAAGGTVAAGGQALSVALASRLYPGGGLEATSIGLMVGFGRLGQIIALNLSGSVLAHGVAEQGIFAIAAVSASVAAICAVFLVRTERVPSLNTEATM